MPFLVVFLVGGLIGLYVYHNKTTGAHPITGAKEDVKPAKPTPEQRYIPRAQQRIYRRPVRRMPPPKKDPMANLKDMIMDTVIRKNRKR